MFKSGRELLLVKTQKETLTQGREGDDPFPGGHEVGGPETSTLQLEKRPRNLAQVRIFTRKEASLFWQMVPFAWLYL